MKCEWCEKEIPNPNRDAYFQQVGYARPKIDRSAQSGSSLVAREFTGKAVCRSCMTDRLHLGAAPGQGTLT